MSTPSDSPAPEISLAIQRFIDAALPVERVWVACSGGVDSTVLLHAVAKAGLNCPVAAIYVNHQLSPNADIWERHVRDLCADLGVTFVSERVEVGSAGGLEQAARRARYQAFARHLCHGDLFLTAHHQQDQAETLLLRLMRGSGLRGLGAMRSLRPQGVARLGRPLLGFTKSDLLAYAQTHHLRWVEDESNQRETYDRNFLRAQVMPLLQQRWPQASAQFLRSTALLQEAESLIEVYAEEDWMRCEPRSERLGYSLLLAPLLTWAEPRRNQVVRFWLQQLGYRMPEQKQFVELSRALVAAVDQSPVLLWQDCEIRRFQQRVYCLPRGWEPSVDGHEYPLSMTGAARTDIALGHVLMRSAEQGLSANGQYTVMSRAQCPHLSRAHPSSRRHSQSLKKLLQEYAVEPWLRPCVPLVFAGEQLVAVADLWVEKGHHQSGPNSLELSWHID